MTPDSKSDTSALGNPRGGPKSISPKDWLFGYAPRRRLLTQLFGPSAARTKAHKRKGLSAAQLAKLGGKGRATAPGDIAALEALGLIKRVRVGKRDRYFPVDDCRLARSLCVLLDGIERLEDFRNS